MRKLTTVRPAGPAGLWPGLPPGENPYRALVDSIRDYAIFLLDAGGVVRSWNSGAELIEGYTAGEVIGQHLSFFYTPGDVALDRPRRHLEIAERVGHVEDEGWRTRKGGLRFFAHMSLDALRDPDGVLYGYAAVTRDLTEHRRREEELKRSQDRTSRFWNEAIKDPLTGVFNRRYMVEHLRGVLDRGEIRTAALLVFDIDFFKSVNDRFGHTKGDAVLTRVAEIARRQSRDSDVLFRLGGDEFVMYLPGVDAKAAAQVAERLRAAVERSRKPRDVPVTISLGVAQLRADDSADTWLERADAALYQAKHQGRNRVA